MPRGEGGIAKAQGPILPLLPLTLQAHRHGLRDTAWMWAQFRLCVEGSARTACVCVCAPQGLLCCRGCQQNCCRSRNHCQVTNWPSLGLGSQKYHAPVWSPTCGCHREGRGLAKAFPLLTAAASPQLPSIHSTPGAVRAISRPGWRCSSLACVSSWSSIFRAGECGMAVGSRRGARVK